MLDTSVLLILREAPTAGLVTLSTPFTSGQFSPSPCRSTRSDQLHKSQAVWRDASG